VQGAAAFTLRVLISALAFVALWSVWAPAELAYVTTEAPRAALAVYRYVVLSPLAVLAPAAFSAINRAFHVMPSATLAVNRMSRALPWLPRLLCAVCALASAAGAFHVASSAGSAALNVDGLVHVRGSHPSMVDGGGLLDGSTNTSALPAISTLDLPYRGPWSDPDDALYWPNVSLISSLTSASAKALVASTNTTLPIICSTMDSGASASSTDDCNRLVNVQPCNEIFGGANGCMVRCHTMGDMPVIGRDGKGELVRWTFTNVRCVPEFKYTLISVTQVWREQGIDARFRDLNHLVMPVGGVVIPYDPSFRLPTAVVVSDAILTGTGGKNGSPHQTSLLGFHEPASTAHIKRMSAAQASELIHRRNHHGIDKIRALHHCSSDAPRNLTSAPKHDCVWCAAARITKASHSGSLHTPSAEPGILHIDVKGPFPPSIHGNRYAIFFTEEVTRFVFFEAMKTKDECINATERAIAAFNATVGSPINDDGKPVGPRPRVREIRRDHEGKFESNLPTRRSASGRR
jgi:hypothetical protein